MFEFYRFDLWYFDFKTVFEELICETENVLLNKYFSYSGDIEVTVELLIEIDKLIQLLESPIFTCKIFNNSYKLLFFWKY